jgi:four helix bundle protein
MSAQKIESYRDLIVWQKAMDLVVVVYRLTDKYPKEEMYGITAQMRRAAISIPSNIAEGTRRGSKKDFRQFLLIAFGSGSELETQLELGKRLHLGEKTLYEDAENMLKEVMPMLNRMISKLNT